MLVQTSLSSGNRIVSTCAANPLPKMGPLTELSLNWNTMSRLWRSEARPKLAYNLTYLASSTHLSTTSLQHFTLFLSIITIFIRGYRISRAAWNSDGKFHRETLVIVHCYPTLPTLYADCGMARLKVPSKSSDEPILAQGMHQITFQNMKPYI